MQTPDSLTLLAEIRDLQRAHLDEYKRVAHESLQLSRRAVERQEQIARFSRWVVLIGGLIVVSMIGIGLLADRRERTDEAESQEVR